MPAMPPHRTATTERREGGPEVQAHAENDAATLRYMHAWRDPSMDPTVKAAYKFPHHATMGGPALLGLVRNGLTRLSSAQIPAADKAAVERHLRRHLDDANS